MNVQRLIRIILCASCFGLNGCTSLREIPRTDYGTLAERKNVRVNTRDGLVYEFDYVRVDHDSLLGFRRRDVEGAFDEFATHRVALEDIQHLSSRRVDWYRTGLIGGGAIAAVVAAGLNAASRNNGDDGQSGGGKPPGDN